MSGHAEAYSNAMGIFKEHLSRTSRRLQIPIRDYLASILPGLADLPVSRVAELTPTA